MLQRFERARGAERVYLRGLDRLDGRWAGTGRDGAAFLEGHPYARDLDLFGRGSLFELLNTTRTEAGEETLADWLRAPAPLDEVRARQAAVAELRPMLDFREDVAVLAASRRSAAPGRWRRGRRRRRLRFAPALRVALAGVRARHDRARRAGLSRIASPPDGCSSGWSCRAGDRGDLAAARSTRCCTRIDTPERDLGLLAGLLARIESRAVHVAAARGAARRRC